MNKNNDSPPDFVWIPLDNNINMVAANGASMPVSDTVPPQVLWQREHRKYTDKWWGLIYLLAYIAFLGCGIAISVNSHEKYDVVSDGNGTDTYYVSSHYEADVKQCCKSFEDKDVDDYFIIFTNSYNLCGSLRPEEGSDGRERRYLAETGNSNFRGDEGIFDAFLDAPEIIVGIMSLTIVVGLVWIILLRFFAKPIVIGAELAKIAIFIYMGIVQENMGTRVLCFLIAVGILAYDIWARKEILYAADIISYAVVSFKANPIMFVALIFIQLLFAANALLFVFFFSKSFNVAEVSQDSCHYKYAGFVDDAAIYMSLAYLWTIFLFNKMRLSVIATIIGSWHFHQEDKPGIVTALLNTTTTSFGTLSVSALISTVAERVCRMSQEACWKSWLGPAIFVTAPLQLILCIFGTCIGTIIKMLTKYAVIMHVWTGLPFIGSAKKVKDILSRHFKGGFVTEVTSQSVLRLASYAFSLGIAMLTWVWFDDKFNTDSLSGSGGSAILFVLTGLFALWYPVLGLYVIIMVNSYLRDIAYQHIWLPPLAAIFVGCLTMMFFVFLSDIFLDTIDTLFLCFAVDKDNNITNDSELEKLVSSLPVYLGEVTQEEEEKEGMPVAVATAIPIAPSAVHDNDARV